MDKLFQHRVRISAFVVMSLLAACGAAFVAASAGQSTQQNSSSSPAVQDFEGYRTKVEPIFLKQRENGVRCYDCHSTLNTRLRLAGLPAGSAAWTEAESHKNYEQVLELIVPGDPLKSRLLLHPLAAEAGGDPTHGGG